jgi:DNA polymerase III delta subunit
MAKDQLNYKISYNNLVSKLEKDSIPNIILLSLKEKILLDDIVKIICAKFIGKNFDAKNNLISFNGDDRAIENILNECSNTGLFSDKKVVVLRNVKKLLKDEKMSLVDYFKRPNPDTVFLMVSIEDDFSPGKVFLYDSKSENEKAKEVQKVVESSVKVYEINEFTETDLISWIKEKFGEYKIDETAINQFIQYSNFSLDEILSEIEKLKTYCYNTKEVTIESVNLCNGIAKDFSEADFIKAIVEKDYENALKIYDKISLKKDVEVFLIFLLNSAFIVINKLYDPGVVKLNDWQRKKELKLWSAEQDKILPYYQRYKNSNNQENMKTAFSHIYLADKLLKSSGSDKRTIMSSLIGNICRI